jgi:hypothetical protein
MIVFRVNASIRRQTRSPIGFTVSHHIFFKILVGLICFTLSVHLLITRSLSDLTYYTNDASMPRSRHSPSTGIPPEIEDRSFPRVATYLQSKTLHLKSWEQSRRRVRDMGNAKARETIAIRDDLDLDVVETDVCKLPYTWQKTSFPSCNSIHEFDITRPWSVRLNMRHKLYRVIGNGYWRDVWLTQSRHGVVSEKGILKTMRYGHDFTPRNFDRMRRDGVVMERLTQSPFVLNIYSFCGTTSLTEYGEGGDIPDALWSDGRKSDLSQLEKLRIGTYLVYWDSNPFDVISTFNE